MVAELYGAFYSVLAADHLAPNDGVTASSVFTFRVRAGYLAKPQVAIRLH